jgi:hypothetical protein
MASRKGEGQFGAFIEPHGIYLIEYRRERDGITIIRHYADDKRVMGLADAGEKIAALIQKSGVIRSRLSAAVRGFGSAYQIMMLPPAEPAVLTAVVRRELARLNPDLESPRVDFVLGGEVDRRQRNRPEGGRPQQEVLVGAAPDLAVSAFGEELAAAGIELDHLTLLPQVIQRLYQRADGSPQPTACFVELAGGPLIAFFNNSQLRLVVEPPVGGEPTLEARVQTLVEHLERGNLYLRQQFRGVELSRLLIAVNPEEQTEFLEAARSRLGIQVEKFPGPVAPTGALVAMGAVLDAEAEKGLNLSPYAESPESKTERKQRRAAILAGAAVSTLAIVWAVFSLAADIKLARKVESERATAEARMNTLAPIRVIASQRQKNAQSIAYLEKISADREHTQEVLRALVRATPPGVQLTTVSLSRSGDEWSVQINGSAFGDTGADVLLGIDRFFHSLPRELPMHDLVLSELDDTAPGEFGSAMKFGLTFVASAGARKP